MGERIFVLDASAVIAFAMNERGAKKVADILSEEQKTVLMTRVNWGEVLQYFERKVGAEEATQILDAFQIVTDLTIVETDRHNTIEAASLRSTIGLSMADSYAVATTVVNSGTLIAADQDFKVAKGIVSVIQIR